MIGGNATAWLRSYHNVLMLSHAPVHGRGIFAALVAAGGLDLDATYRTMDQLFWAIRVAKKAAGADARLALEEAAFFEDEARPVSGPGSAGSRDWMYSFQGQSLLDEYDDEDTVAMALLRASVEPKRKSKERDQGSDNYCRFLMAVKNMTASRSDTLAALISDPNVPADEIAEYVADMWRQLAGTGIQFRHGDRMSQRVMELETAASLATGSDAQKEAAFQRLFPSMLSGYELVEKCVSDGSGMETDAELLGYFEQVATSVIPGTKWRSVNCLKAVEFELSKLKLGSLIDTWGKHPQEILSNLRAHFKRERAISSAKGGGNALTEEADKDPGINTASEMSAMRRPDFINTREKLKGCGNFLDTLDTLLESKSKLCYMKGIRQINKQTSVEELENCSKHLTKWCKYWPMEISKDSKGRIHAEIQGKSFPEKDVEHLLAGDWHLVDWIRLIQHLDLWTDNVLPDSCQNYSQYETLCAMNSILFKTMKMLKLAQQGEDPDGPCTCYGFMQKIIKLERRSRATPQGSAARQMALQNVVNTLHNGLKEFGERWSQQWIKPTNYNEELVDSFADGSCFIMKTIDRLDKVADQMFEYKEVFPILFGGGSLNTPANVLPQISGEEIVPSAGFSIPLQRPNPSSREDLTPGESNLTFWESEPP